MDISISTYGPAEPLYVLELAEGLAAVMRALAHLTRHHSALGEPSDADRLLRHLEAAASGLPQLLEQVSGWLAAEEAAGWIGMAHGSRYPSAALAGEVARMGLERAQVHARMLQQSLEAVASVTSEMAARDDGDRLSIWKALLTSLIVQSRRSAPRVRPGLIPLSAGKTCTMATWLSWMTASWSLSALTSARSHGATAPRSQPSTYLTGSTTATSSAVSATATA